jgi:hypothetical protein
MGTVRRFAACAVVLSLSIGLVAAGTALANHLDPQKRIRPADQARAQAMLLRTTDLDGVGWQLSAGGAAGHLTCKGFDESDLTVTGEVGPRTWTSPFLDFVSTGAQIYKSVADANASWRRGTSTAGKKCAAQVFTRLTGTTGGRLISLKTLSFPKIAPRTTEFRIVFLVQAQGPPVTVDIVVLQRSRAQAFLFAGSLTGPPKADEVRLARLVAGRMAKAMRGG